MLMILDSKAGLFCKAWQHQKYLDFREQYSQFLTKQLSVLVAILGWKRQRTWIFQ